MPFSSWALQPVPSKTLHCPPLIFSVTSPVTSVSHTFPLLPSGTCQATTIDCIFSLPTSKSHNLYDLTWCGVSFTILVTFPDAIWCWKLLNFILILRNLLKIPPQHCHERKKLSILRGKTLQTSMATCKKMVTNRLKYGHKKRQEWLYHLYAFLFLVPLTCRPVLPVFGKAITSRPLFSLGHCHWSPVERCPSPFGFPHQAKLLLQIPLQSAVSLRDCLSCDWSYTDTVQRLCYSSSHGCPMARQRTKV